ncbi:MAG: gamma-glutamyltransferase [Cyanobacteria bacterium]|nr:gamma-glutamyltransferase [Cyanobacteriota bacterium]
MGNRLSPGMVVCPHHLASEAGAEILRAGGNAIDAAISTQAALGVVYPHMTGLGGDAFWLIYDAASQALQGLNGSGRAAQQATLGFYRDRGCAAIPQRGPLGAITVPGAVDSWAVAHDRLGQLPWADLLQPAITLAKTGYPATGSQAYWTRQDLPYLTEHGAGDCPFLPKGHLPEPGQWLTNPDLANTLDILAREGAQALYQGELADRIDAHLQTVGGLLTGADLAAHHSDWVNPISTTYRGHTIWQLPPNSQGFTVLQALNLIEGFDLQTVGHGTADYYHLLVEATKLAFADRDRWLTDPDFATIPTEQLIAKTYGDHRRSQIEMNQAGPFPAAAIGGDTVYTAVVDGAGNAVSVIQSVYFDFGSAVMVPGTGFVLQNRGSFFSLDAGQINGLAPGKRTFHTLMPGMVCTDNRPEWVLGTMGGEGQPQTQLALLTRLLDYGFDPQTAIDLPRWLWGRTWGDTNSGLTLEGRIPATIQAELQRRGHPVKAAPDWTEKMGHAHVIHIDPTTGTLQGGCDRRSDGAIAVSAEGS